MELNTQHRTSWRLDDVVNDSILFCFLCVEIIVPVEVMLDLQHINNAEKDCILQFSRKLLHVTNKTKQAHIPALLACQWPLLASC